MTISSHTDLQGGLYALYPVFPIGGTDPIANERDGSMLHICRKYHPECVMLYLSKEMAERHHRDDRYRDSLRRLADREGFSPEILVEEREALSEVQVYDTSFQEFRPLLLDLHSRFPEHQLILNVASGTPAMKSALYLLAAFLPFPVLPVQTAQDDSAGTGWQRATWAGL